MVGQLQIEVLGELNVRRDGQLLPLPQSKKTRALLGYLAVVGRPQRREHLCKLFWEVPDDPRASLRWSLYKIRQITNTHDVDRLTADHHSVLLIPQAIDLDFTNVASLRPGDLDTLDVEVLESLAAAFRGEFLEGLRLPRCPTFEAWRLYHRDLVLRSRIEILRRLVSRLWEYPERARFYAHAIESLRGDAASIDLRSEAPDASVSGSSRDVARGNASATANRAGQPGSELADASAEPKAGPTVGTPQARSQAIRFCRASDRVRVAYALCGRGPAIVRAAHWMSHLQYDWESPVWRHWIDALSEEMMLIRYDERGNGLSDWDVADFSFAAMVTDLESVVDAAGLERFTLLGVSQSCAVSVAYAVRHPERLSGLILYGGFVQGWRKRSPHDVATHEAMTTLIREGWGNSNPVFRHLFTTMFIPGASQEQMGWFDELQRITVSPDNACRLHEAFGEMDVSDLLSQVAVPTLVLHARRDAAVPFGSGREFATGIPGARFVDLDSANHILLGNEPAFETFIREVGRFVAETVQR
ncbi:alpha/beta fold hydrolase [Mesorhizobium escarrei]|uniref:SARP family transcriptional regulator n=1 Tax=Mesorhizobium escarrei TaxID=666018 RepID=A0ABM9E3D1_9HYPH|nr:alpha/beta fold hydrolase [Mesorhizobium escarrei]CAH2403595.1 SARP family transcriptional regulator [Mesorhizobium escarrei]